MGDRNLPFLYSLRVFLVDAERFKIDNLPEALMQCQIYLTQYVAYDKYIMPIEVRNRSKGRTLCY